MQYQVPARARTLPLVMWHGGGQFSKTWETTPDGREGFRNIFVRRRFSVYTLDQPRRGRAAKSMAAATIGARTGGEVNLWRVATLRARLFVDLVNKRGGRASLVYLPDVGLKGNTHFPFSDLNNLQVADRLSEYFKSNKLD